MHRPLLTMTTPSFTSAASETTINNNMSFQSHTSFAELVDSYDGFILDQFGVMHNGTNGLDGAPECVAELASKGKSLIILSNSSSLSLPTLEKLHKRGFNRDHFVGAVTSGEEASRYVKDTFSRKKALFLTWKSGNVSSPMIFLNNCGDIGITENVDEADFVLLHGAEVLRGPGKDGEANETSLGSFSETGDTCVVDPFLEKCASRKLPMVCCNPDYVVVKPDGGRAHMPGKIARRYESVGGDVTVLGKPHVEHFEACLRDLRLSKDRVAHVGDSLHHDVVGANETGIASIFVAGGVHREELGSDLGELPSNEALEKLFQQYGITPTHVVPMLKM